jgi:cell volume regulation protein A
MTTHNLPLPGRASLLCVMRDGHPLHLTEHHLFAAGDHVYLLATPLELDALDKIFVGNQEPERLSAQAFFG